MSGEIRVSPYIAAIVMIGPLTIAHLYRPDLDTSRPLIAATRLTPTDWGVTISPLRVADAPVDTCRKSGRNVVTDSRAPMRMKPMPKTSTIVRSVKSRSGMMGSSARASWKRKNTVATRPMARVLNSCHEPQG